MIITTYDTEFLELLLGLLLSAWGLWLLNPSVVTFDSTPSFRIMAEVGSETAWGSVMLGVGVIKVVGLGANRLWARCLGALCGTCVWVAIAFCIGAANPAGTGIVVYPTFALASIWVLYRLSGRMAEGRP